MKSTEDNDIKNYTSDIPYSCGRPYKREAYHSLEIQNRKDVAWDAFKLGITDYTWRGKGEHKQLWNPVCIIGRYISE